MSVSIFDNTLFNFIGVIPVDTKDAEYHSFSATPTNFAIETGSTITDHMVVNPYELEIPFRLSNIDISLFNISPTAFNTSYGVRAATIFNLMQLTLEERISYIIVTRHFLYSNMFFIGLDVSHEGPFIGSLSGTVRFQQINTSASAGISDIVDKLSDDVKSAANPSEGGLQQTTNINSDNIPSDGSLLYNVTKTLSNLL